MYNWCGHSITGPISVSLVQPHYHRRIGQKVPNLLSNGRSVTRAPEEKRHVRATTKTFRTYGFLAICNIKTTLWIIGSEIEQFNWSMGFQYCLRNGTNTT